jgi:heptosyltransferase-3
MLSSAYQCANAPTRGRDMDFEVKRPSKNVLIFRIGSVGDTIVALPSLKLIARAYADANRIILTNLPRKGEAPVKSVLNNTGVAHGYIGYPVGFDIRKLLQLRRQIASLRVDTLIYLTPRNKLSDVLRDVAFFRACGISHIIGAPFSRDLRRSRSDRETRLWEHEGSRLARCLSSIGEAQLSDRGSWSLELNDDERAGARHVLDGWSGSSKFIAMAAGAKTSAKDWGVENWIDAVKMLGQIIPNWGMVLIGSGEDAGTAEKIAAHWSGPVRNLCGALSPRVSAAVIERAKLFVGHDGGPMHLAAAVGTPIIAIFSGRDYPGTWFPFQQTAEVIYPKVPCYCRGLEQCNAGRVACMQSIKCEQVITACRKWLELLLPNQQNEEAAATSASGQAE